VRLRSLTGLLRVNECNGLVSTVILEAMRNPLIVVLLSSLAAFAQKASPPQNPCDARPLSMLQMRECADSEYKAADAHLNRVYRKAMQYMNDDLSRAKEKGEHDQISYEKAGIAGLKEAERAWLSYRDLQCKSAAQRYEGGTMAPLVYSNCLKTLTEQRIDDLKSVYEEGEQKLE
jgi:uncharacterized protein YecT (DUF1311 family)